MCLDDIIKVPQVSSNHSISCCAYLHMEVLKHLGGEQQTRGFCWKNSKEFKC